MILFQQLINECAKCIHAFPATKSSTEDWPVTCKTVTSKFVQWIGDKTKQVNSAVDLLGLLVVPRGGGGPDHGQCRQGLYLQMDYHPFLRNVYNLTGYWRLHSSSQAGWDCATTLNERTNCCNWSTHEAHRPSVHSETLQLVQPIHSHPVANIRCSTPTSFSWLLVLIALTCRPITVNMHLGPLSVSRLMAIVADNMRGCSSRGLHQNAWTARTHWTCYLALQT